MIKGSNLNELRSRFPSVSIVLDGMNGKGSGMDCPLYLKGTREMVSSKILPSIWLMSLFRQWKWKRLYVIRLDIPLCAHCTWVLLFTLTSWVISFDLEHDHSIQKVITVSRSGIYSIDKWRLEREYDVTMILNEDGNTIFPSPSPFLQLYSDDGLSRSIIIHGHKLNVDLATTKVESMMRASGDGMMVRWLNRYD